MSLLRTVRYLPRFLQREWDYAFRHLRGCSLEPTYRCNLRCKMCGVHSLVHPGDKDRELSRSDMIAIVEELGRMGADWLQLIGGEPFLRADDMLAVTERANRVGVKTTIVTNGALINEALARDIVARRTPRLIFSVDGLGDVHDRVRGVKGAFERTRRAMSLVIEERRRLKASVPAVEIQCTLSCLNFDQVEPMLRFTRQIGAEGIVFLYISEIPVASLDATRLNGEPLCTHRWAPGEQSCLFTGDQVPAFRAALAQAPQSKAVQVFNALGDEAFTRCRFPTRRCYFMRNVLIINPYGQAYPCPHLEAYGMGDVRRSGVAKVWQNKRHRTVIEGLGKRMYPVCSRCCAFGMNLTPGQLARLALGMKL